MKFSLAFPLSALLLISCSDEAASEQKDFPKSSTYVKWSEATLVGELAARLSIIAPPNAQMLVLLGTAEPFALGLTINDHTVLKNGRYYIESDKFVRFMAGEKLDGYRSDLVDYISKRAVGTLVFTNPTTDFPHYPYRVEHLCTGPFEQTCTLSYNENSKMFEIKINPELPIVP